MNISNINNVNAAKIYAETNKKLNSDKLEKNDKQKNYSVKDAAFDKGGINISREAKNMNVLDFVNERIKTDMNKDIKDIKDISADKISQLKNSVKSGSYHIDTNALVSAVISGGKA